MHNIYYQDCEITKGRTTRAEVCERFVAWGVDNLETWDLQVEIQSSIHFFHMLPNGALREIGSTNLLGDTTGLTSLYISSSKFIENKGFTGINVTEDTNNGASEFDRSLLRLQALEDLFLASVLFSLTFFNHLSSLFFGLRGLCLLGLCEDISSLFFFLHLLRFLNLFCYLSSCLALLRAGGSV